MHVFNQSNVVSSQIVKRYAHSMITIWD